MRKMTLILVMTMALPMLAVAGEPYMKLVKVNHVADDHIFLYQCTQTGNAIQVEQRYNQNTKAEEIRFVANANAGEWITKGVSPEIYRYFGNKACDESTTQLASLLE